MREIATSANAAAGYVEKDKGGGLFEGMGGNFDDPLPRIRLNGRLPIHPMPKVFRSGEEGRVRVFRRPGMNWTRMTMSFSLLSERSYLGFLMMLWLSAN